MRIDDGVFLMTDAPAFLDELPQDTPNTSSDRLRELRDQAATMIDLQHQRDEAQTVIDDLDRRLYELSSRTLPELMADVGLHSVEPYEGFFIRLKSWYKATLPKAPQDRELALVWLREHDAGDLVKTEVAVSFGRGEDNLVGDVVGHLQQYLEEAGVERPVSREATIHWGTYTAWVKERMEAGETLPLELLGAKTGRHAIIEDRRRK